MARNEDAGDFADRNLQSTICNHNLKPATLNLQPKVSVVTREDIVKLTSLSACAG
jgi:hypothetical protein